MEKEIEDKIRKADNLIGEGKASSAVTILKEIIKDSPGEAYLYYEFKEGFKWLERAKALNPNNPFVLQNYKIAKDMEKESSRYSKKQIAQLRKEKLKPEARQDSHLYILERFHRGKILTKDDENEIKKELEIFSLK